MKEIKRAYLNIGKDEFFGFDCWIAKDCHGKYITMALTRKECEKNCRYKGYVPERQNNKGGEI